MSVEVTQDAIQSVADILSVTYDQAATLLKVKRHLLTCTFVLIYFQSHNGQPQQAVNAYFENPNALQAAVRDLDVTLDCGLNLE